jgi:hypothetical protein
MVKVFCAAKLVMPRQNVRIAKFRENFLFVVGKILPRSLCEAQA